MKKIIYSIKMGNDLIGLSWESLGEAERYMAEAKRIDPEKNYSIFKLIFFPNPAVDEELEIDGTYE